MMQLGFCAAADEKCFRHDLKRGKVRAEAIWPGGTSGVLGSPFYANLLDRRLTNDALPLRYRQGEIMHGLSRLDVFLPEHRPR